jgi:putative flippase GtrA
VNPDMSALARWGKFNLVGIIGAAVQLGAIAVFNRLFPGRYLCLTAAALELTLLHNFFWHLRYTWSDRRNRSALMRQLIRFHLSNGLVSFAGNLTLVRLLTGAGRVPIIVSNAIAILACSIANFCVSHRWAFAPA